MQIRKIISSVLMFCAFSAQRHRKSGGDNNVLLMTHSLSQRSQPSLLSICTAWLWPCAAPWLYTSTREAQTNTDLLSVWYFAVITDKWATANIEAQSIGDLGKQIAFIWASACFESHGLISNCYCWHNLEDLLKLADSGFQAFIRMPNLPPSTSSEESWVTTLMHLEKMLSRQKPVP